MPVNGSKVVAQNESHSITRNLSFFKKIRSKRPSKRSDEIDAVAASIRLHKMKEIGPRHQRDGPQETVLRLILRTSNHISNNTLSYT